MGESLTLYKLIVLYMLEKVDFPLTNAQISGFILDKGYTTYFHLQQALSELTESELIHCETIRNSSYFSITKSGEQTLEYFGKEIPKEIKGEMNFSKIMQWKSRKNFQPLPIITKEKKKVIRFDAAQRKKKYRLLN